MRSVELENQAAARMYPLCGYNDELVYKSLYAACLLDTIHEF
ncbi:hypothetical protein [Fibrobacter intestinalis]|nr:hypothetical protein [Fibrobacter intestinalis]